MTTHTIVSNSADLAYRLPEGFLLLSNQLPLDEQKAVINTLVLAYAAADKAQPGDRSRAAWFSALRDTLAKVGWVYRMTGGETHTSSELNQTASDVSRGLPAPLREPARDAVGAAFALQKSPELPAPAALEIGTEASESGSEVFNLIAGWKEGEALALSVVQIAATASVRDNSLRSGAQAVESRVEYRWQVAQAALNRGVYAQVAAAIATKVEPVLGRYLSPVTPDQR